MFNLVGRSRLQVGKNIFVKNYFCKRKDRSYFEFLACIKKLFLFLCTLIKKSLHLYTTKFYFDLDTDDQCVVDHINAHRGPSVLGKPGLRN